MTKRLGFSICLILIHLLAFSQTSTTRHTVKKGENVYRISLRYGVSIQAIYKLNPGSDEKILVGEVLNIPKSGSTNFNISENESTYQVKPGDTKFGLSKKFGLSIASLERRNPHIKTMLQSGHIINIPSSKNNNTVVSSSHLKNSHKVEKGDTLYKISNKYGVSVESMVDSNGIKNRDRIVVGQILKVPQNNATVTKTSDETEVEDVEIRTKFKQTSEIVNEDESIAETSPKSNTEKIQENTSQSINDEEEDTLVESSANKTTESTAKKIENRSDAYVNYTVKAQETLYGLSRQANMTISELLSLNPEMKSGVKKGMVIQMPNPNYHGKKEDLSRVSYNTYVGTSIPDLLFSATKESENTVRFYLPFSLEEYKSFLITKDSAIFKTRRNKKSIEFYQGASLAIKNINSLGLNFVAEFFNDEQMRKPDNKDNTTAKKVVMFPYLTSFSSISDKRLSDAIEVVNINSEASINNTKAYNALPTLETQQLTTLNYLKKRDGNVIAISDAKRSDVRELINITLINPTIVDVDSNGLFNEELVLSNLDKNKMNYVILDSEKSVLFLNSTNILLKALSNYQINLVLLDKALFPKEFNVSTKRFNILKTIYPSVHQITTTPNQLKFKAQYENMYGEAPSKEAIFGFDITMDVMLRLSQAQPFEETINSLKTDYLNLKFDYKKVDASSYENQGVFLYQYDGYDKINILN